MHLFQLFHFIRPYWLLALIPVLILLWFLYKNLNHGNNWRQAVDKHLLPHLLIKNHGVASSWRNYWFLYVLALIWLIAIFALAGPSWSKRPQPVYRSQVAKVILLDLSQSMFAQDIKPNRLTRAKYKVLDILKEYPEGLTGMAVYSSEAYTVSPLTNDTKTIAAMVSVLSPNIMPARGSNIAAALKKAAQLLQQGNAKRGTIILMTDAKPSAEAYAEAEKVRAAGYEILVLGIGTQAGAPIPGVEGGFVTQQGKTYIAKLDNGALEKLARIGAGHYHIFTDNNSDINYILAPTLRSRALTQAKKTDANTNLWNDEGRWFILLLLPFLLLMFRRGWLEDVCR